MSHRDSLISLYQMGKFRDATTAGELIPETRRTTEEWYFLGASYHQIGRNQEARTCFERVLDVEPNRAEALMGLGAALRAMGQPEKAIVHLQRVALAHPNNAIAQLNFGAALQDAGKPEEARSSFTRAVQIDPLLPEGHCYLGSALSAEGDKHAAVSAFQRAITLRPTYAIAHNLLANTQYEIGERASALTSYATAIQLNPRFAEAHYGAGLTLKDLGRREESISALTSALELDPTHDLARAQRLYQQAQICDWPAMLADRQALERLGLDRAVSPFALLALDSDPRRQMRRAEKYAESHLGHSTRTVSSSPYKERIRIGYFSADFRNHAMMHVLAHMFELHDKSQFETHAFSFNADASDSMTARVSTAFEYFHDVSRLSAREIAASARAKGLDIAIDLMGYTKGSRSLIFAYRAAPIQMSYLGHPGTMGTSHIDYLIADRTIIPPNTREYYRERIVYLPYSYQVSDTTRVIAPPPTRSQLGLPESGFVFCCFNNTYKISSSEFDIWMRLLRQIRGSVLWLVGTNASAEKNLRREAAARDVDPARIVFAPRVPTNEHLSRQQVADLFLDTFNYNAHGTANDALWAGLPILTKPGQSFPSRVGASVLTGAGVPELIAEDEEAYERIAFDLATHPTRLSEIRNRLIANRATAPLFDTALFTKHLEAAFNQIHQRCLSGLSPADLDIRPFK